MRLNEKMYLEYGRVNVMLAHDFYSESHQGDVGIIQINFSKVGKPGMYVIKYGGDLTEPFHINKDVYNQDV